MTDKRSKQRIKVDVPCRCVAFGFPQTDFYTSIINLGPNGLAILSNTALSINQEVEIHIDLKKERIEFKVKIVNCETVKIPQHYIVRAKIIHVSPSDEKRYFEFYLRHLASVKSGE